MGERYLPLVKPYDAAMHLGHMASYREALRYSHGRRVLDLGCGTGYGAFFLASHGARRVSAVDLGVEGLAYGAAVYRHPRLVYVQADAPRLPFADASFDFVFSSQVIEHVPSPEAFLQEIRRVLAPGGFCLVTTPNRALFSPCGPSGNVHHLNEMDVGTYAATARRVFPRVEIRGIPQRCLTLRPGERTPSARPNAELRPEDYRVQRDDAEGCENLLCFAHPAPSGRFVPSLPPTLESLADELAPMFWDPRISRWVLLGVHPPDGPSVSVPLRFGQQTSAAFRSPRAGLYRVEVDTVRPPGGPVRLTLHDGDGELIADGVAEPSSDRLALAFDPQPRSRDRWYNLALRLPLGARALRHLVAPARLEGRVGAGRLRLAVRTFHAGLPQASTAEDRSSAPAAPPGPALGANRARARRRW
jgi:SAM-dependent methyltransferase